MANKKYSVITTTQIREKLLELKGDLTYNEVFTYLLDLTEFRTSLKGSTKAEMMVKKWLAFGHEKAITPTELRFWVGVNLNTCKDVISQYSEEIEQHNKRFG